MEVCEYCFERMHRTQIEEHRSSAHREVMEAESIIEGLVDNERKGLLAICVWIGLEAIVAFMLYALGVDSSLPWILITVGIFAGIGVTGLAVHLSTPIQVREARSRAREVILKRMVKCDVCDRTVPYEDHSNHIRQFHPRKMPYEWYRTAIVALLVLVGGGGYIALELLSETEWLSDEEGLLLVVGWIAGTCLIFLWMFYEYHVGELRHIQRMRRHWDEHKFDSKDLESQ